MMTAIPYQTPTFSIFKASDSTEKVETLEHCFMQRRVIDSSNPPAVFKGNDGWVYTAVYESQLPVAENVEVIISFQKHSYGRFAVIRLAKDKGH